jgi:hypothetical protein
MSKPQPINLRDKSGFDISRADATFHRLRESILDQQYRISAATMLRVPAAEMVEVLHMVAYLKGQVADAETNLRQYQRAAGVEPPKGSHKVARVLMSSESKGVALVNTTPGGYAVLLYLPTVGDMVKRTVEGGEPGADWDYEHYRRLYSSLVEEY